jgi:hypothetical protein
VSIPPASSAYLSEPLMKLIAARLDTFCAESVWAVRFAKSCMRCC